MKNEISSKDNQNEQISFPIQAIMLLAVIGVAVLAIVLKMIGIF